MDTLLVFAEIQLMFLLLAAEFLAIPGIVCFAIRDSVPLRSLPWGGPTRCRTPFNLKKKK